MRSRRLALDETFLQPARATQSPLEPTHLAGVALVIIAKEVQQTVQGEDPELRRQAVSGGLRLAPRNTKRNHDIS
jgi:hypothetical protein